MRWVGVGLSVIVVALSVAFATPAAAQYDCNDPGVRAAQGYIRQAVAQSLYAYQQSPPAVRAQMDAIAYRQTGYSYAQLLRILQECAGGGSLPRSGGTGNAPAPPPAAAPAAKAVPRVLTPDQYRVLIAKIPYARMDLGRLAHAFPVAPVPPSDGVAIGGVHLSLCWQLYHRTDCSDTAAAQTYAAHARSIIESIGAQKKSADAEVAKLERQLTLFHDAQRKQDTTKVVASMRQDNEEFMRVRDDAIRDATFGLVTSGLDFAIDKTVPDRTGRRLTVGDVQLLGKDMPAAVAMLGKKAGTGERLDALDRETLAETIVGAATSATSHAALMAGAEKLASAASGIGTGVTVGMSVARLAGAAMLDNEVQKIDRAILEPQQRLASYERDLQERLRVAQERSGDLDQQLARQQQLLAEVAAYPK